MITLLLKPLAWLFIQIIGRIFNITVLERGAALLIFRGLSWLSTKTSNHLDEQLVETMKQAYYGADYDGPDSPTNPSSGVSTVDNDAPDNQTH